jgi:hypothetical protein
MSDDYPPHDDLTPIRANRIQDPKMATTRRQVKCWNCGALNDCEPCPPAVEISRDTQALRPKIVGIDVEPLPFPQGPEPEPTKIMRPEAPGV